MLTVHHLNNSRSQRVLWLLEELGVPYENQALSARPGHAGAEGIARRAFARKSPVITDQGHAIAESGRSSKYIIETYGNGRRIPPSKTAERLRYTYWLHYAEGSAMTPLLQKLVFSMLPRRSPPLMRLVMKVVSRQLLAKLVDPRLKQHMDYWEQELTRYEWFAGNEFTAADVQMSFPLEAAAARGGLDEGRPRCMAFLEKIHARPAYHRALVRGGPYAVGR